MIYIINTIILQYNNLSFVKVYRRSFCKNYTYIAFIFLLQNNRKILDYLLKWATMSSRRGWNRWLWPGNTFTVSILQMVTYIIFRPFSNSLPSMRDSYSVKYIDLLLFVSIFSMKLEAQSPLSRIIGSRL